LAVDLLFQSGNEPTGSGYQPPLGLQATFPVAPCPFPVTRADHRSWLLSVTSNPLIQVSWNLHPDADENEVKRKVRPAEPPLRKRRDTASNRTLPRLLANEVTARTLAEDSRVADEFEAEQMVTRICDSILGRLSQNEPRDDETKTMRLRRRTS